MAAEKKLIIGVEAKVGPSVQKLSRILDDLSSRGNKFARALSGTVGPGGGSQTFMQGAVAKSLLQETKLFETLGKSGEKLAKILDSQVVRSQQNLKKNVETTATQLDKLVKKHEWATQQVARLEARGAPEQQLARARSLAWGRGQQVAGVSADLLRAKAQLGEPTPTGGGLGGGLGGGTGGGQAVGSAFLSLLRSYGGGVPGLGVLTAMGVGGAVIGAGAAGFTAGYRAYMSQMTAPITRAAMVGSAASMEFGQMLGSDWRARMGRGLAATQGWGPDMPIRMAGWEAVKAKLGAMWEMGFSNPRDEGATFRRLMSQRLGASARRLQVERAGELGEAFGVAGDITGGIMSRIDQIAGPIAARFGRNQWMTAQKIALATGLRPEQVQGFYEPLAGLVGARSATGFAGRVSAAVASGMDPGSAVSIAGAEALGGGRVFRASAGFDPTIRANLGAAVANTMAPTSMMFAGKGTALAEALVGAMTVTGGAEGVRQSQQAATGMQMWGQVMGGTTTPYQRSYNIAAAASALGAGANPYQMNFLATQMSDPAVLAHVMSATSERGLPPAFRSMGINLNQAKAVAKDIMGGMLGRWYDVGGTGAAFERTRAVRDLYGGDVGQYLKGIRSPREREQAIKEMAPLWGQIFQEFGGEVGGGEAMLRAAGGLAAPGHRAAGRGRGAETPEAHRMSDLEAARREALAQEIKSRNDLTGSLQEGKTAQDEYNAAIGDGLTNLRKQFRERPSPKKRE